MKIKRRFLFFFCLSLLILFPIKTFSKEYSKVHISNSRIIPGEKIEYTISDDTSNYHCEWYVDDELISSNLDFIPDESCYEKFIKLIVFDSDNNNIGEDSIYCSYLPVLYIDTEDGEAITR